MSRLVWAGSALASLWLVMSFTYPFGWDQGLFAWVGDAIVRGGVPYRDAWDIKGPLLYYVYALAQWTCGVHLWSIRIIDAVFLGLATIAVLRIARALGDARSAGFAAVFFVLWYASHSYWHTAQPDGWAGMLLIAAFGPLLIGSDVRPLAMARTGLCLGLAALLKPLWVSFLLLVVLYLAISGGRGRARLIVALVGGWVFPVALAVAWFAWQGALNDFVDVHLKYAALYGRLASDNRLRGLAEYFLSTRVTTIALPVALFGLVVAWNRQRAAAGLLLAWVATTVILVSLQGRFYAYHWLPMLPAMSLLVGIGIHALSLRERTFARIACALILLSCAAPIGLELARFTGWRLGAITRQQYYDAYGDPGADMRAVDWLQTMAAPGKVFAVGWHCSIPWLSGRETVSRFCYSLPLMMGDGTDTQRRYRAEVLSAINADPPKYIVVGSLSEQILGARLTIDDFPELAALVRNAYKPVAQFGALTIHEIAP